MVTLSVVVPMTGSILPDEGMYTPNIVFFITGTGVGSGSDIGEPSSTCTDMLWQN